MGKRANQKTMDDVMGHVGVQERGSTPELHSEKGNYHNPTKQGGPGHTCDGPDQQLPTKDRMTTLQGTSREYNKKIRIPEKNLAHDSKEIYRAGQEKSGKEPECPPHEGVATTRIDHIHTKQI